METALSSQQFFKYVSRIHPPFISRESTERDSSETCDSNFLKFHRVWYEDDLESQYEQEHALKRIANHPSPDGDTIMVIIKRNCASLMNNNASTKEENENDAKILINKLSIYEGEPKIIKSMKYLKLIGIMNIKFSDLATIQDKEKVIHDIWNESGYVCAIESNMKVTPLHNV